VRIVLDTAVLITALRTSAGAAGRVVNLIIDQEIIPLMDYKLGAEYRDVALRPEHLRASGFTPDEVLRIISAIEKVAEAVDVLRKPRPLSPDPDDDMVLDIAINGNADALVTNNLKHFAAAGKRFGIPVLTPREMLETFRKEKHGS
jgi:putative PIN family toxin of toxin-antitoxin system